MISIESFFSDLMFELKDFVFEGEFYFNGVLFKLYFIILFLLLILVILRPRTPYLSDFERLGYSDDTEKLKLSKKAFGLQILGVHPKNLEESFWRNQFEIFENIVGRKFIDVSINGKKVNLYYDNLPAIVPFENCPALAPMQAWLGNNQFGKNVIINLQSTPAIYVDGKPGSGKTVAIHSILKSYQVGLADKIKVIAVSTKPADYYTLKRAFDIEIINPFDGDMVENIQDIISFIDLSSEERAFQEIVKNNLIESESMNLGKLREEGRYSDQPRKFFIFDEAKDYLAKDRADSKEEAQAKQQLIKAVYSHIRRNARFLSTPILIASQTQTETDLDIPLKAFHQRLASNTNEAMSKLLCGDKRLTDLSFRNGKYFVKTSTQEHIIKIPF
jgi:hypothetical protein